MVSPEGAACVMIARQPAVTSGRKIADQEVEKCSGISSLRCIDERKYMTLRLRLKLFSYFLTISII